MFFFFFFAFFTWFWLGTPIYVPCTREIVKNFKFYFELMMNIELILLSLWNQFVHIHNNSHE